MDYKFRQLLHQNLDVEIVRVKDDVTPFGTYYQKNTIALDEDLDILYLILTSIKPYDTLTSLTSKSILNGGSGAITDTYVAVGTGTAIDGTSKFTYDDTAGAEVLTVVGWFVSGTHFTPLTEVNDDYNVEPTDSTIVCNKGTAFNVTLLDPSLYLNMELKFSNQGAGTVTVGGEAIQDTLFVEIAQFGSMIIQSDGTKWCILAEHSVTYIYP